MKSETYNFESSNRDELDIKLIFKFLLRNKLFISYFSVFFFICAAMFSLTLKRLWEGQFQIVLNSQNLSKQLINPKLSSFLDIEEGNDLKTEVGILKSPSILMPVFEVAKKQSRLGSSNELIFSKWKKNLDIKLEKNTSILNISYKDSDKDLILPILEKMTTTYQDYSGRKKKRTSDLTIKYLSNQIDIYKEKSSKSLKTAQKFAIDQDLIVLDYISSNGFSNLPQDLNFLNNDKSAINSQYMSNIGIENIRVKSANEIRQINSQIKNILEMGDDYKKLKYIGSAIPSIVEEGLPLTISEIEKDLSELRTIYSEKDKTIKNKIQQRDALVKLLRERVIGDLNVRKLRAKSVMESAIRPKGVLLKYKELMRQAQRDELTLVSLENQIRIAELEQARLEDPWDLITKPTLLNKPVGTSRTLISIFGIFTGFLLGCLIAFFKEYKSGRIFDKSEFEKILLIPFLDFLNIKNKVINLKELSFFSEYIINQEVNNISFITLNKGDYDLTVILKNFLIKEQKLKIKINLIYPSDNINQCVNSESQILFASLENTYSEIKDLKNKLKILNVNVEGFFLFNNID